MLREDTSLLDVIILVVFAGGMNIWWGSETPFAVAKDYSPEQLIRFEQVSSGATVAIGLVASMLTRKVLPVLTALVLCVILIWLYDWEYTKAHPVVESEV